MPQSVERRSARAEEESAGDRDSELEDSEGSVVEAAGEDYAADDLPESEDEFGGVPAAAPRREASPEPAREQRKRRAPRRLIEEA